MKKRSYVWGVFVLGKVTIPLLSIKATGKIADKLIFEKWKNKQTVKKYKRPFNPDTDKQKTQRSYMMPVIEAWRGDGYTQDDKDAWNFYAKVIKISATGYNMFTRFKINAQKAGFTWDSLINCQVTGISGSGCSVTIEIASDKDSKLYYGSSKVALYKEVSGVFSAGVNTFTINDLEELTRYYFYIKNTSAGEAARTGVYTFKTLQAGLYGWYVAGWFSANDWFTYGGPIVYGWFDAGWFNNGDWFSTS